MLHNWTDLIVLALFLIALINRADRKRRERQLLRGTYVPKEPTIDETEIAGSTLLTDTVVTFAVLDELGEMFE